MRNAGTAHAAALVVLFAGLAALVGVAAPGGAELPLAVAAIITLLWCVLFWRAGIFVLLAVATVDGFVKLLDPNPATYLMKDAVLGAVVLGVLIEASRRGGFLRAVRWGRSWPVLLFIVAMALFLANDAMGFIPPAVAGFRERALFATLFFVGGAFFDSGRRLTATWYAAIAAITFAALAGIVQMLSGPLWASFSPHFAEATLHYRSYAYLTHAGQELNIAPRAFGTLVDPAALGLASGFGIVLACAAFPLSSLRGRLALGAAIVVMVLGLMYSGARAGMLAAMVGVGVLCVAFAISRETRRFVAGALLVLAIAAPIGVAATAKANATRFSMHNMAVEAGFRTVNVGESLRRLRMSPFGAGFGSTGEGGRYYRAADTVTLRGLDDLYFAWLYETGLVGLGVMLFATGWILVQLLRRATATKSPLVRCFSYGVAAAECGLFANGLLSQGAFDYAPVAQTFWLFAGTLLVPSQVLAGSPIDRDDPSWPSS